MLRKKEKDVIKRITKWKVTTLNEIELIAMAEWESEIIRHFLKLSD